MSEQLKFNLIRKYKAYDLPVEIYNEAIKYAEEHAKKDGLTLIESASYFIENSVLMQVQEKGQYRRMIDAYYVNEASKYSSFFDVSYNILINDKDKIVDDIILEGSNDYNTSLSTRIRKIIDTRYKATKKQISLFDDAPNKNSNNKTKEIVFDENMKFLKKYYSISELNKITGVSTSILFDTLVSGRKMSDNVKEKILSSFCVTSSEMLFTFLKEGKIENLLNKHQKNLEKENEKIEKISVQLVKEKEEVKKAEKIKKEENNIVPDIYSKTYSIAFLKEYFEKTNYSKKAFARHLGVNIAKVDEWLDGALIKGKYLYRVLVFFEEESLPKLISRVRRELNDIFIEDLKKQEESKKEEKIYNISFFNKCIETNHINKTNLSNILDMSKPTINKILLGERLLKEEELNLLLKYFKVSNFDELKTKIIEESNIYISKEYNKKKVSKKNTKIETKIYDISFLNSYIESKKITKLSLTHILNSSFPTVNKMLVGERLLTKEELNLLFNYYDVDSYESLKKKLDDIKNDKEENVKPIEIKYNISFLNSYIKDKNISINEISEYLNYSANSIKNCLVGESLFPDNHLNKLLKFFGVSSLSKLENIVKKYNKMSDEEKYFDERHKKLYDLTKYSEYIKKVIGYSTLAQKLSLSYPTVTSWFYGRNLIRKEYANKIFKILGVKNLRELDAKSKEVIVITKDVEDYTFLKEILIIKNISQGRFAREINVNENQVYKWSNNINKPSIENIKKILEYLGYNSLQEIKEEVEKYKKENNINGDMNKRQKIDLTCVDEYLKINGISYLKISNDLKIDYMSLTGYLHNKRTIPNIQLSRILEYLGFTSLDQIKIIVEEHKKENNGEIIKKAKDSVDKEKIQYINDYMYIKGISYAKLSELTGRLANLLSRWLNGQISLSYENFNVIIKSLGFNNIEELISVVDQNKKENDGKLVKEDLFLIQSETMNYIKEYMIIKNISNEKLAKMLKLNRDTISKWINNRVFISDKKIENLVNVLCFNNVKELKDFVDEYKEKHNGKLVIEELTDMSYIKEYIGMKGLSIKEVATSIGVNQVNLSRWLNNSCGVNEYYIEKILNHLGFKTISEVKTAIEEYKKEHECDNIDKHLFEIQKENFKYIREYMTLKGIKYEDICKSLGFCITSVANWFNNRSIITTENYTRLLEFLGFNNIEELKQVVDEYKEKYNCDDIKENLKEKQIEQNKYLKEYIIINSIKYGEIAQGIDMKRTTLVKWMSQTAPLSAEKLAKMIEYLGFNDLDELKNFVDKFKEENDGKLLPDDEDLRYVNEYLKIKNIYKKALGREMGIPESTMLSWLDTKYQITNANLMKILNHLGFNHIKELKEYVGAYNLEESLEENKKDDIISEKISEDDNMQNEDVTNRKIIINSNVLYELLKGYQVDETEYQVIGLLFGGLKDKCYSIEEVSKIIDIDKKEVLKIYQVCLKIYFDAFSRKCEDVIKYSLSN